MRAQALSDTGIPGGILKSSTDISFGTVNGVDESEPSEVQ